MKQDDVKHPVLNALVWLSPEWGCVMVIKKYQLSKTFLFHFVISHVARANVARNVS